MPRMTNTFMAAGTTRRRSSERRQGDSTRLRSGADRLTSRTGSSSSPPRSVHDRERPRHGPGQGGDAHRKRAGRPHARLPRGERPEKLDAGIGTCGRTASPVPVGVGLPTIRIDGMTVGGTRP